MSEVVTMQKRNESDAIVATKFSYVIVESADTSALCADVEEHMQSGYDVVGGPFVPDHDSGYVCQAMQRALIET